MKITDELVYSCARICHSHYGINQRPTKADLDFARHVLACALIGGEFASQKEVDEAVAKYNESQK